MTRVTIVVPEILEYEANELASCIGYAKEDNLTFSICPAYEDKEGKEVYLVASVVVEEEFLVDALSPLVEPEWGADMEAANTAQSSVVIKFSEEVSPKDLSPDTVLAVVSEDAQQVISSLKLHLIRPVLGKEN